MRKLYIGGVVMENAFEAMLRVHSIPLIVVLVISFVVVCLIKKRILRLLPCLLLGILTLGLGLWTLLSRFNVWILALLSLSACYFGAAIIGTGIGYLTGLIKRLSNKFAK